ncbi:MULTISPECIES: hypothetical protein [Ramlibacter]|uniref:Acyl-protein synthetase LuxE domain-containing protein n=1 Tax=Ramlibacter pinisoli TaxID=2682844 RepID=A0A6N8J0U7_9BURK|nr:MULTISPECIES: hypothetical protein [Ramlibacter]MBA2962921.1 hypothetical protein [Ramlibacter sp. CGMCC 1.13660]MVQ32864.1 hypothetical protein [Ramlibacter pinisoli]
MSKLLEQSPYASRDDAVFLREMNELVAHHRHHCPPYATFTSPTAAERVEDLPFVHVGLFKRATLRSNTGPGTGGRTVLSSATSGQTSRVFIDDASAALQARSSQAILADFIGGGRRPLLVLDSAASLRRRGEFSARILAAMSLKPFASEVFFLLSDAGDPASFSTIQLECALNQGGDLLVYGFSWMLWLAWARRELPQALRDEVARRRICFVHSGGWKKLEAASVDRAVFDSTLLAGAGTGSLVLDYYGLVEQMGVVFPVCDQGARHVPRWADVLVRDSWSLAALETGVGQLQLLNTVSWGAPCHSVLTEDLGRLLPGRCACSRSGPRFELLGRVPQAELRGCANV